MKTIKIIILFSVIILLVLPSVRGEYSIQSLDIINDETLFILKESGPIVGNGSMEDPYILHINDTYNSLQLENISIDLLVIIEHESKITDIHVNNCSKITFFFQSNNQNDINIFIDKSSDINIKETNETTQPLSLFLINTLNIQLKYLKGINKLYCNNLNNIRLLECNFINGGIHLTPIDT